MMKTENMENEEIMADEKKREIAIPGEKIVTGKDYLPGEGTRREGDEVIASRYGLAEVS